MRHPLTDVSLTRTGVERALFAGPARLKAELAGWRVPIALEAIALLLWCLALPTVDLDALGDLGLAPLLPPIAYLALALVVLAFVVALTAPVVRPVVLGSSLALLAFMLFGVVAILEDAPRFATTYVHVGFAEAIGRTGELFPGRDARFDWPIFFTLLGFIEQVSGLDLLEASPWVPLVSNALYVGPLWVLYRTLSPDPRLAWLGLMVFVVANWIGQDYLSPQGFNFLLYLVVITILVRWFRSNRPGWPERIGAHLFGRATRLVGIRRRWRGESHPIPSERPAELPVSRPALVAVVATLTAVVVSSHQLTPFVLLMATTALVVVDRCWLRGLPLLVAVMIAAWLSYMTVTYLAGHLPALLGEVGRAGDVAASNVEGRLRGSDEHLAIVYIRLVFSLAIWALAALGAARRLAHGHLDLSFGLLAALPFGVIALQSYGGEILLRVYLFALPFMAFFVAAAIRPVRMRMGVPSAVVLTVLLISLVFASPWARYGNERADRMTRQALDAVGEVYEVVPAGSLIVSGNYNSPFRHTQLERYQYRTVGIYLVFSDIAAIRYLLDATNAPESYLLITDSMRATSEMFGGMPPAEWDQLMADLRALPYLEVELDRPGAVLFRYLRAEA